MSIRNLISPQYELMATMATPAINFGRGILGFQDPVGTQMMKDRMLELESQKGTTGTIGYEDYGLQTATPGGRFTGGLMDLALNNPVDFALAGSVGRYGFSPKGRTGLTYDFTPDQDTGTTGNALLDFINEGGIKGAISRFEMPDSLFGKAFAPELTLEERQAIAEREALNREGLMAMDDAGLTISPYEEFARVAKPGFNLDFAKQLGKQALTGILTKLDPITGALVKGASFLKESPEQKAVSDLYDLDDTGTVRSGIMAGYNPSSVFGPVGLTKSMLARIDTINKNKVISDTLERRKKELEAKIAAEQKALRDFNRERGTGGYQAGYSKDFMEGSGKASEMGST